MSLQTIVRYASGDTSKKVCDESSLECQSGSSFQPLQLPGLLLDFPEDSPLVLPPASAASKRKSSLQQRECGGSLGNQHHHQSLVLPLKPLQGQCSRTHVSPQEENSSKQRPTPRKFLASCGSFWLQSCLGVFGSSCLQSQDGDLDPEDGHSGTHERFRNLRLYINAVWVLGLTIADIVVFLIFQVFAKEDERYACSRSVETEITLNVEHITLIATILVLHFCYIVHHHQGTLNRLSWHMITLVASVIVLFLQTLLCCGDLAASLDHLLLHNFDQIVHLTRVVLLVNICRTLQQDLRRRLQRAVSLYRRRYLDLERQLDLDITYIADRVLAMSIPCVDSAPHRNDIADVARFFASRHYGSFAILNLCQDHEERGNGNYHPSLLFGQVQKAPMRDHTAPRFQTLIDFCDAATDFLNAGEKNVVAVHCQGGKGRTGLFVCALLLWVGFCNTAQEALQYFAKRRSMDRTPQHHLVRPTSPSQIRYLHYVEKMVVGGFEFSGTHPVVLDRIIISHPPLDQDVWNMALLVEQGTSILFDMFKAMGTTLVHRDRASNNIVIQVNRLLIDGDVTVRIYSLDSYTDEIPDGTPPKLERAGREVQYGAVKGKLAAFVQVHTATVAHSLKGRGSVVAFRKQEIDGAYQDTSHKLFHENFSIGMELSKANDNALDLAAFYKRKDSSKTDSQTHSVNSNGTSDNKDNGNTDNTDDNDIDNTDNNDNEVTISMDYPTQTPVDSEVLVFSRKHGDFTNTEPTIPIPLPDTPLLMDEAQSSNRESRTVCRGDASEGGSQIPVGSATPNAFRQEDDGHKHPTFPTKSVETGTMGVAKFARLSSLFFNSAFANNFSPSFERAPCLHDVVAKECSGVRVFHCGEVILDTTFPEADDSMSVYYVISGRVQMEPLKTGPVAGWSGCLGMSDIGVCATVGRGQLFGCHALGRIVPGGRKFGKGLVYRVKSQKAEICVVKLNRELHDQPEDAPDKSLDQANWVIYHNLAHQLCEWSTNLRNQMTLQRRPRKANAGTATVMAAMKQMHEKTMELHCLPQAETVLTSCQASHVTMTRKDTNGQLLLFKNWLIFRAQNSSNIAQDVKIALEQVSKVSLEQGMLTIQFEPDGEAQEQNQPSPLSSWGSSVSRSFNSRESSTPLVMQGRHVNIKNKSPKALASSAALSVKLRISWSGKSRRRSSLGVRISPENRPQPISFVVGGGGRAVNRSRNEEAVFERVCKQHSLVKARTSGAFEELGNDSRTALLRQMVLGPEMESVPTMRRSAEGEEILRRWGFVFSGERVEATTLKALTGLFANASCLRYCEGECLISAGNHGRVIIFIQSGRISTCNASGEKLEVRQAGDVMGAKAFFSVGNYGSTTSLFAETETEVLMVDHKALDTTCCACPAAGARFYRTLAMHLGVLNSAQFELLGEEVFELLGEEEGEDSNWDRAPSLFDRLSSQGLRG